MTTSTRTSSTRSGDTGRTPPSLINELWRGTVRWDLLTPFPEQDGAERRRGDEACAELAAFLRDRVDPTRIDEDRDLPAELVAELRARGYHRMFRPAGEGGLGLSYANMFRVTETAASWSVPLALMFGKANALSPAAYLPLIPPGALNDRLHRHLREGTFGGSADTEPTGAGGDTRTTTATLDPTGTTYRLDGEKTYITNGTIADLYLITATLRENGTDRVSAFFVDADSPGFEVVARHDLIGLHGSPNAHLRLSGVEVPAEYRMSDVHAARDDVRRVTYHGRTLAVVPAAVALTRMCAYWSREFVNRRRIDGRPLGGYDEVQHMVAETVAEAYAMDALSRWTLLGGTADTLHEHAVLKNVATMTCWRAADRTVTLLGAEGLETAASKARRGVPALPVERALRDARVLRVAGGVDFLIDFWCARIRLADCHYRPADEPGEPSGTGGLLTADERLAGHAAFVDREAAWFGAYCAGLAARHGDRAALFARQHLLVALNRIANELLTMAVVLARGDAGADLADVYCRAAGRRVTALRAELDEASDRSAVAEDWLRGDRYAALLDDVITGPAEAGRA
ncbi:hypothetical protein Asp14428_16850 [Actinoplanes sp. NBRC 14428]|nr:hypothetical protein Asp14428_16850 [Actinoplanes sp. NBRC 14428]